MKVSVYDCDGSTAVLLLAPHMRISISKEDTHTCIHTHIDTHIYPLIKCFAHTHAILYRLLSRQHPTSKNGQHLRSHFLAQKVLA